jgi:hypothetical protein
MGIGMIGPVAPVAQRHVIVDRDEIDLVIGPERVEVEIDIPRPVLRMIAEIFGPVRGIAELGIRQQRAHLGRQRTQPPPPETPIVAHLRQPAHFRPDAERLHPARGSAQRRAMQDEPANSSIHRGRNS